MLAGMRPPGTPVQLEKRRRHAVQLLESGKSQAAVARQVGASLSSVARWWDVYQRDGPAGLQSQPIRGRPPRLSDGQKRKLIALLVKGPLRAGYRTDLWTLGRVAELISEHFAVRYHPSHVWKILNALGWSCQKPERRAVERDEPAIAQWKQDAWPRIKKRRRARRLPRLRR